MERLIEDLLAYRASIDELLAVLEADYQPLQQAFLDVALKTNALYGSNLEVRASLPVLYKSSNSIETKNVQGDIGREMQLRRKLRSLLESNITLACFDAESVMFAELDSQTSYVNTLTLHVPEMYEESFQTELIARSFLHSNSSSDLTVLERSLDHLCHHHLLFVQPALDELADAGRWNQNDSSSGHLGDPCGTPKSPN